MLPRSVASLHVRCRARVGAPPLEGPAQGGVGWGLCIRGRFWLAILNCDYYYYYLLFISDTPYRGDHSLNCEEVVDVPIFVMHALDVRCREMRA
eukprot:2189324-Rhodomonas_salina.1